MNEQTPRDPQQPDRDDDVFSSSDPTPRDPATSEASATASTGVDPEASAAPSAARRSRSVVKPVLIGSAAALTVLAVAGVGMTIADAFDDGDDAASPSSTAAPTAPAPANTPGATSEPGDDGDGGDGSQAAASSAPSDLVTAIEAAVAAAGGGAATSIEVEMGAWDVDVRLDDGSELDVRVPVTGDAVVREDDDDDRSSDLALEPARVADIVGAAVAAAGGGSVTSIETDDDGVRYEVEVDLGGVDIDVDLAEDLSVLAVRR